MVCTTVRRAKLDCIWRTPGAGEVAAVDAGEVLGILGHDLDQVIGGAGHQVAFEDVGDLCDLAFKGVEQVFGLGLQGYFHENRGGAAHLAGVQKGDIGGDDALVLEALDAAVAGGGREVYLFAEVGIGDAGILLQGGEDAAVGCVQIGLHGEFFDELVE